MVITWNELRDARERLNLTQEELASELGVSTRTVTNWEANGVPRKAEYKVERYFGDTLVRAPGDAAVADARHADVTPSPRTGADLSFASDVELLEELLRRAAERALYGVSLADLQKSRALAGLGVGPSRDTDDHAGEDFDVSYENPTKNGVALAAKRGKRKADQPHAE